MNRPSRGGEESTLTLTVLRSSGERDEISASFDQSLRDLKSVIAKSSKLGRIPTNHQRLFHLGRELKTSGRTLEALGIRRFGVTVLHVQSTLPPERHISLLEEDDDDDDDDVVEIVSPPAAAKAPPTTVNLADDSDDDDDDDDNDDDCVIVEVESCKRPRLS